MNMSFQNTLHSRSIHSLLFVIGLLGTSAAGYGQTVASRDFQPDYSQDIAAILFDKCASCHNPDGIGPMSLLSYEQVRP